MTQPFYITTAIPYANGAPHIGHAYERICTDAIARFMHLEGRDVFFVTGMDEYGLKMQQTAQKQGITPQVLADQTALLFEKMGEGFCARADDVVRTTELRHLQAAQALWQKMKDKGDIYLSRYAGWYSVRDEAYYDEQDLVKGEDGAYVAPTGTPVEWMEEESYFFKLSAYTDKLLDFYARNQKFVIPNSYFNEIKSFVERGLNDISISRTTFEWGVPVPKGEKADQTSQPHVMYVWVDALTNYITATGFPDKHHERSRYWPADMHVVGKDITRFHAIYWPAFLMSAEIAIPKQIVVHGFLLNRGEKMSKSVGNIINPMELLAEYGVDAVRYFFLREVSFGQDGQYSKDAIVQRVNADLANDLGNLAQRSLSMIAKHCMGKMPKRHRLHVQDEALLSQAYGTISSLREYMQDLALHLMLQKIWELVGETNRYFATEQPWAARKNDPERMETILNVTSEALRVIALLCQPFIPKGATQLLDYLAIPTHARDFTQVENGKGAIPVGTILPEPMGIFPRYTGDTP